mmetsp:Transcript_3229/g.11711  ORF Transcript_3229/g.11711 Transcript_3229/m.11711 type:complete len:422 (+) Transcript_3229:1119-2384(+)
METVVGCVYSSSPVPELALQGHAAAPSIVVQPLKELVQVRCPGGCRELGPLEHREEHPLPPLEVVLQPGEEREGLQGRVGVELGVDRIGKLEAELDDAVQHGCDAGDVQEALGDERGREGVQRVLQVKEILGLTDLVAQLALLCLDHVSLHVRLVVAKQVVELVPQVPHLGRVAQPGVSVAPRRDPAQRGPNLVQLPGGPPQAPQESKRIPVPTQYSRGQHEAQGPLHPVVQPQGVPVVARREAKPLVARGRPPKPRSDPGKQRVLLQPGERGGPAERIPDLELRGLRVRRGAHQGPKLRQKRLVEVPALHEEVILQGLQVAWQFGVDDHQLPHALRCLRPKLEDARVEVGLVETASGPERVEQGKGLRPDGLGGFPPPGTCERSTAGSGATVSKPSQDALGLANKENGLRRLAGHAKREP